MDRSARVFVAGHRGLVGSAITRRLRAAGYDNLILRTRRELDLTDQAAVRRFFSDEEPEHVVLAAAKVGGILANNSYPGDFIGENLMIQTNVTEAALRAGVRSFLFLGSSCVYPKHAPQPMREEHLLTSALEPTNEWYAVAKIAGIKLCQAYRRQHGFPATCLMPSNLYGPNDNFDLATSHVLPALLRKFHEAKVARADRVVVWGSGTPRREFLHVDDLADAVAFLLERGEAHDLLNVGVGADQTIRELAETIRDVVGFRGALEFDASKPDGTPRKLLDVSRLAAMGWKPKITLREGLERTYRWYLEEGPAAMPVRPEGLS